MEKKIEMLRFWIITSVVSISGFSQGMLLPLIAVIFEETGVSSSLNGFHATSIYIGILLAAPFMETPLRKWGYKKLIAGGGFVVGISLFLFPFWHSFWFWFILRLLIGIGDHMIQFASQTWITSFSSPERRGRNIALYGLFFGLGYGLGPFMTRLVSVNEALPFQISALLTFAGWLFVFLLKDDYPETDSETISITGTIHRFGGVLRYGWVALLPVFGYGFLDASLSGVFPVYALRTGINVEAISLILPAFAIGGIVFQLPLGMLSDRFGRQAVLSSVMFFAFVCFTMVGFLQSSTISFLICFFLAGMAVGSTFSLGITYMADLIPRNLFPAGSILAGILFSIGSITGPVLSGMTIHWSERYGFFMLLSFMLMAIFVVLVKFRKETKQASPS